MSDAFRFETFVDVHSNIAASSLVGILAISFSIRVRLPRASVPKSTLYFLIPHYLSEHYDLEDRILKHYPQEIKEYEERIIGYGNDAEIDNSLIFFIQIQFDIEYVEPFRLFFQLIFKGKADKGE